MIFTNGIAKEGVSKSKKSRSPEVQKFCHYYNDTSLSDAFAFDRTPGLLDFLNFDTPSCPVDRIRKILLTRSVVCLFQYNLVR